MQSISLSLSLSLSIGNLYIQHLSKWGVSIYRAFLILTLVILTVMRKLPGEHQRLEETDRRTTLHQYGIALPTISLENGQTD